MKHLLRIILIVFISVTFLAILHSCKKATVPVVTTYSVDEVTQKSAISGGNIIDDGGAIIYGQGICWDTIQYPNLSSKKAIDRTGNSAFYLLLTDLTVNTTYYVRAYAFNCEGVS